MLAIFEGLLSNLIVASLIATLALVIGRFWRNPVLLHVLWLLVLVKLFTPPLVTLPCLPDWSASVAQLGDGPQANDTIQQPNNLENEHPPVARLSKSRLAESNIKSPALDPPHLVNRRRSLKEPENSSPAIADVFVIGSGLFTRSWPSVALVVWLTGSILFAIRSILGIVRFFEHLKFATAAPDKLKTATAVQCGAVGLKQIPEVMLLPGAVAPMIWAPFSKSYLLLPQILIKDIDSKKLNALITHEIGHLYLRHHWVRRFELMVAICFWWCPLVWFARRKLREYEEEICDAWVVQTIPGIEEAYAHALVDTVNFLSDPQIQLPPIAVGNNHFQFLNRRITMIMQNKSQFKLSLTAWLVVIAVMLFGLPISPSATQAAANINSAPKAANVVAEPGNVDDDRDDDWDEEDGRDDDGDDETEDIVEEIIEEITEGLTEMNEEIMEAIEEARDEIQEEVSESPQNVLVALSEIDVDAVIADALDDAPRMVHLFVDEVDPAGLIAQLVEDADFDDDDLDEKTLNNVRSEITNEFSSHIAQLSRHSKKQIADVRRQITDGIAEVPLEVRQRIAEINLPGIVDEVTEESHPIVKEFVKEVNLRDTLKRAMRSAGKSNDARIRVRDRKSITKQRERHRRSHKANSKRSRDSKEHARVELEQQLADLMNQVEMIQRELRELDKSDR